MLTNPVSAALWYIDGKTVLESNEVVWHSFVTFIVILAVLVLCVTLLITIYSSICMTKLVDYMGVVLRVVVSCPNCVTYGVSKIVLSKEVTV